MEIPWSGEAASWENLVIPRVQKQIWGFRSKSQSKSIPLWKSLGVAKLPVGKIWSFQGFRSKSGVFAPKVSRNPFHYGNPLEWRSCQLGKFGHSKGSEANLGFSLQKSVEIHSIMEIPWSGEAASWVNLVIPRVQKQIWGFRSKAQSKSIPLWKSLGVAKLPVGAPNSHSAIPRSEIPPRPLFSKRQKFIYKHLAGLCLFKAFKPLQVGNSGGAIPPAHVQVPRPIL
jgi:hypothetical protein